MTRLVVLFLVLKFFVLDVLNMQDKGILGNLAFILCFRKMCTYRPTRLCTLSCVVSSQYAIIKTISLYNSFTTKFTTKFINLQYWKVYAQSKLNVRILENKIKPIFFSFYFYKKANFTQFWTHNSENSEMVVFHDYNQPLQLDYYLTTKSLHICSKPLCTELEKIASWELQLQIEPTMWVKVSPYILIFCFRHYFCFNILF